MVWRPPFPSYIHHSSNLQSDVLYSEMSSRNWSIIIEAYDIDFAVQRDFELVAGILPKATVTVGITSLILPGYTPTYVFRLFRPWSLVSQAFQNR